VPGVRFEQVMIGESARKTVVEAAGQPLAIYVSAKLHNHKVTADLP